LNIKLSADTLAGHTKKSAAELCLILHAGVRHHFVGLFRLQTPHIVVATNWCLTPTFPQKIPLQSCV